MGKHKDDRSWVELQGGKFGRFVVAQISPPKIYGVTPTVNGVAVSELALSAAASNAVLSARVVFNAFDLVTAGQAILNRFPDVKVVEIGDTLIITSDTAITSLYAAGLSSAANPAGNVIDIDATDEVIIRAELTRFDFVATDNIKTVEISLGSQYSGGASTARQRYATLKVEGFSHVI